MKLSVFCGVSVDGFLARADHALDFLHTGEQEPHDPLSERGYVVHLIDPVEIHFLAVAHAL